MGEWSIRCAYLRMVVKLFSLSGGCIPDDERIHDCGADGKRRGSVTGVGDRGVTDGRIAWAEGFPANGAVWGRRTRCSGVSSNA